MESVALSGRVEKVSRFLAVKRRRRRAVRRSAARGWRRPRDRGGGDIACDPSDSYGPSTCHQKATSDLLVGAAPAAVFPLGDIQYDSSSLANIIGVYDPSWGRVKAISHPVLGNHERQRGRLLRLLQRRGRRGRAGGREGEGWYSFDVGTWHLVALNSNCTTGAPTRGLRRRLRAGAAGSGPIWRLIRPVARSPSGTIRATARVTTDRTPSRSRSGTRSRTPRPKSSCRAIATTTSASHRSIENGAPDPGNGIRQFVVGTGGAFFTGIGSRSRTARCPRTTPSAS